MTKTNSKHTEGPWRVHHEHRRFRRLILSGPDTPRDSVVIAEVLDGDVRLATPIAEANARLIAAAPCLLKAIFNLSVCVGEAIASHVGDLNNPSEFWRALIDADTQARATIASIEKGESK